MVKPRTVLIRNIPAPYRAPVHSRPCASSQFELLVLFCADREVDRPETHLRVHSHLAQDSRFTYV